jgi:hypothetical protein
MILMSEQEWVHHDRQARTSRDQVRNSAEKNLKFESQGQKAGRDYRKGLPVGRRF